MASLNQASIIGYLGDEPRIIPTQNNRVMAAFAVATTEKGFTTQDNKVVSDRTEWHNVVLWGKLAEVAQKYLHKGAMVYVQGKMRTRQYQDKNNQTQRITEIEGDVLQMLDRKQGTSTPQNDTYTYPSAQGSGGSYQAPPPGFPPPPSNDLPF